MEHWVAQSAMAAASHESSEFNFEVFESVFLTVRATVEDLWLATCFQLPVAEANRAHETLSVRTLTNSCRCSPGRNLKNLVIENSGVSGISVVRVGSAQQVRRDHCQAAAAGSVTSEHHGRRFDRSHNDRHLALVQLEPDNLPGSRFPYQGQSPTGGGKVQEGRSIAGQSSRASLEAP